MNKNVEMWETSNIQVFWGEIAPCDHLVQFYETDKVFLDTLEGYAGTGFLAGESVIVLGTSDHIESLNKRLVSQGFDLEKLKQEDQYIAMDADDVLARILVNNWVDKDRFDELVTSLIQRAGRGNRKVRAFGELVAVLWDKGLCGTTVQLEHLWHQFQENNEFTLYCAYPKAGFTQSPEESIDSICKCHSKLIDGQSRPSTEIYYRSIIASK